MKKEIKLFQDMELKLVTATDMKPSEVHADGGTSVEPRTTSDDPMRVDDDSASVICVEGYASVFVNPDGTRLADRDNESVSIALLDIENYKKNPVLVFNHDWSDVSGKITSITKDAKGLYIKAEVHKFTGREQVFEAVQKGIIKTFSIGFVPKTFTYLEDEDIFEISSAELVEISLAPVPANQDAIFQATSQKSLRLDKEMVKEQTKMTCDELSGICTMSKTIKGKEMDKEVTETPKEEIKAEPETAPKEEVKAEPETAPKEEVKVETPPMDVDSLANAISQANALAEAKKEEKEAAEAEEAKKAEEAEKAAMEARVKDSLSYIKERQEAIMAMDAGDLDVDELADFYELLSDTVEIIDGKVQEAVSA